MNPRARSRSSASACPTIRRSIAIDQLKGKKIGISSAGSLTDWLAKELARKQGWGPHGRQRRSPSATAPPASSRRSAQHLIDADVGVTSLFLAMEENKTGRLLFPVHANMKATSPPARSLRRTI